ncbi:MAG: RusA family crossover junction endodeoxyribonuclease [Oscillospiraceae bacterium]
MKWTEEQYAEYLQKRRKNARKLPPCDNTLKTAEPVREPIMTATNDNIGLIAEFTIPLAPVTKKNHSRIVTYGKRCPTCKKGSITKLIPSKQYEAYEAKIAKYLNAVRKDIGGTITCPVNLKCLFYCETRRQSDLAGHLQSIQDLLVEYEVIEDDCRDIIASTDGSAVLYDKENPRTEITITRKESYEQWAEKRQHRQACLTK